MALQTERFLRRSAVLGGVERSDQTLDAVDSTLRELDQIARLEQDWDSYGAEPPSAASIDAAAQLAARAIAAHFDEVGDQSRPWAIAPFSGGVQLEWRVPNTALEIEIDARGRFGYLLAEGPEPRAKYREADDISLDEALALVATLFDPR